VSEDRALADYNIALANYDRAIGATLETHAIELADTGRR